ncbi:MAG: response regulator transcription factor, partial [Lachnospiraceae bacterium]
IIKAIHQLLAGQSILAGKVLEALSRMMAASRAGEEPCGTRNEKTVPGRNVKTGEKDSVLQETLPKDLTARELEVCALLTKGYSNGEIARELFLAEGTVKNYMMSIYDKFAIHDRTTLVLFLKEILR